MLTVIIHPPRPLFRKGGKKTLVVGRKDCELDLESCELVGSQVMR